MQSFYPACFERDMACTEAEWLGWLPAAMGSSDWQRDGSCVHASLQGGKLSVCWQVAPPRIIALLRLPRLLVRFQFEALDETARYAFMKRFDLYMQRGGG